MLNSTPPFDSTLKSLLVLRKVLTLEESVHEKSPHGFHGQIYKVETPIHDSIRELVTWECKEHGVNIMNVLANPKGSVGHWNLNIWRLEQFYTNF
jgi:hypothetical protein